MRKKFKRILAIAFILVLIFQMAACSSNAGSYENGGINVNETIASDSKWINSSIVGAIDETTNVRLEDDFYTYINRDFILSATLEDDESSTSALDDCDKIIKERKLGFISGDIKADTPVGDLTLEQLEHNQSLVSTFALAAADWDTRNSLQAEPLKKYIDAIEAISSIDELTSYLTDIEGDNLTLASFLNIKVMSSYVDQETYRLAIFPSDDLLLDESDFYKNINSTGFTYMDLYSKEVLNVLTEVGYSEDEAREILMQCYQLEGYLVDHDESLLSENKAYDTIAEKRTYDELVSLCGSFPVMEILECRGMDNASEVHFCSDSYLRYLSSMYTQSNLELIKSYLIAHTAKYSAMLLTRDDYNIYLEATSSKSGTDDEESGTGTEKKYNDEWDYILNDYVLQYLAGPMDTLYISKYCTENQKEQIIEMVDLIKSAFYEMIDSEDWMSDDGKEASRKKLDNLSVRAVYPDTFEDYSDIVFESSDTLVEMVHKIACHDVYNSAGLIDRVNDHSIWDLDNMPTTIVNAFYMPGENSINILSGILASELVYSESNSIEANLGAIGAIIGHEITHGFDTNGCKYDEYGYERDIFSIEDKNAFMMRANSLQNYYSSLRSYRSGSLLSGYNLSGEAIADMGGIKLGLITGSHIDGFDYDEFFRSWANIWREYQTFERAEALANGDNHPPAFLRVNVTLMQFEEFYETYDIKAGDGMYLAPDKRISVW